MNINLNTLQTIQPKTFEQIRQNQSTESAGFSDTLKTAINDLNDVQVQSDIKTEMLVNGQIDDLHDVMITAQKASVSLNLAVQMQSKAIDAYNEMMRMQI